MNLDIIETSFYQIGDSKKLINKMWEKYWRCKNSNRESNEGQDRPMLVKEKTRCVEKDEEVELRGCG